MKNMYGIRFVRIVGLSAIVATLAAACSSSGGGSSSTPPPPVSSNPGGTTPSSSAPALTGTPIKIGMIASLSGSQASSSSQGGTVGPAWAEWVNANGGIAGHPVQVIPADDAGDPAKAQAAEKKLVDQDNVVALLVGSDNLLDAFAPDALKKGVPLVGGPSNNPIWYSKTGVFPIATDTVSGLIDQVLVAKQYGSAKKFANLYCAEIAICAQAVTPQKAAVPKIGIGFTSLAVSSTATSYTAQCLSLQQQGVDYAQLNFTTAAAAKFVQDCQAQNYNPTWGISEQAVGADYLKIKSMTAYGPAYVLPSVAQIPATASFRDAMDKYAKDDNWHEETSMFVWAGLELLRKVLANVGANPTRADVMAALYTVKNETLGGLVPNPITYTKGKPVAYTSMPCTFVVGLKDGQVTAPEGTKTVCASS